MILKINRKEFTENSIIGELFIDDEFFCYTLENPQIGIERGRDLAIPYDTYKLKYHSPSRFEENLHKLMKDDSYKMICVYNDKVPPERAILIHWGNTAEDTAGCILLGQTKDKDFIGSSKIACYDFYEKLKNVDLHDVTLKISSLGDL